MSAAIPRVRAVAVLPLDFVGRLRILRTMHLLAALHGASLLDGPDGSDPGFYVVWCRFRMLRRHMACNSVHQLARVKSLLRVVSAGAPGCSLAAFQCFVSWVFLGF